MFYKDYLLFIIMVSENEMKKIVQDVAAEHKLNRTQIQAAMNIAGISDLLVNPLVCAKCGHKTSVVGKYNTCDACEESLSKGEKLVLANVPPMYEDEFAFDRLAVESEDGVLIE
jgi:predicted Zn-ribbon and HTH transcriptional regulator